MTGPRLGQGAASNDPIGWIARQLESLQTQITELRAAQTLNAATIGKNGLTVQGGRITIKDASGVTQALLDEDGLSVASPAAGNPLIPMSGIAFGPAVATDQTTVTTVPNDWTQGTLTLTVPVATGRLIVFDSGELGANGNSGVYLSHRLANSAGTTIWDHSDFDALAYNRFEGGTVVNSIAASRMTVHTGLAVDTYTITNWYHTDETVAYNFVRNLALLALPI